MAEPLFKLNYTLTSEELYSALAIIKTVPSRGLSQYIRTGLLAVVLAILIYNMSIDPNYFTMGLILTIVSVILIALIWIAPANAKRSAVNNARNKMNVFVDIYPGLLVFNDNVSIMINGQTATIEDHPKEKIFIIFPYGNKSSIYIIPYRIVSEEHLPMLRQTLLTPAAPPSDSGRTQEIQSGPAVFTDIPQPPEAADNPDNVNPFAPQPDNPANINPFAPQPDIAGEPVESNPFAPDSSIDENNRLDLNPADDDPLSQPDGQDNLFNFNDPGNQDNQQ